MEERNIHITENIMKQFMEWYIPRHEDFFDASKIMNKLYEICVDNVEFYDDIPWVFGKLVTAVVAFYEHF